MSPKPHVVGSRSDVGCVRKQNEDALIVQSPLYAVADGMGGHAAGEIASELAVNILAENALAIRDANALIDIIRLINRSIITAASDGPGRPGMGTTLTAALLDGTRLLIAQVGDSRAYLLHEGKLQQLTRDHSYVSELLAGGHISASEARAHPKRSVITRALGSDPKTEADIYELVASVGDRLLICTDGLFGMVREDAITAILESRDDPQDACDDLITAARAGGGLDNISAIVVDINHDKSEFLTLTDLNQEAEEQSARRQRARTQNGRRSRLPRLHLGVLTFLLLLVLLIGGTFAGVYWYASHSAFLRTEEGKVVVYRGLPGDLMPGIKLEWYEYTTEVKASDLLSSTAQRLEEGVRVDSLDDAAALVASYEQQISEDAHRRRAS
ncbi:MAG: Stp1/IreP family PP2C-type Ser/Thr phosphatase [Coriobacteriales bacterium]|jgi:protein phosphatase|nr:Stp1/IreP family PP2C-type Ser/Thr phosphatase [Coriobacteriales bacterium]